MSRLRRAFQAVGFDITRFPAEQPMYSLVKQLQEYDIGCVLDVGANDGDYARELRRFGYGGRIVSFEPVSQSFERAKRFAEQDAAWDVLPYALGPDGRRAVINVAGNAGHSSSLLPMLEEHKRVQPNAIYIASEEVEQRALDDISDRLLGADEVVLLKLDVQGYERQVLAGAERTLERACIRGLQLEMSFVPLYADSWLYDEALKWALERGFRLARVIPGFTDQATGRMLQADGLFFRDAGASGSEPRVVGRPADGALA